MSVGSDAEWHHFNSLRELDEPVSRVAQSEGGSVASCVLRIIAYVWDQACHSSLIRGCTELSSVDR